MTQYILPITDSLHVGDKSALCPPVAVLEKGSYQATTQQLAIYSAWKDYWALVGEYKSRLNATVISAVLGETGDLNKYSKAELFSILSNDIFRAVMTILEVAQPVVDRWVICRGTESHTGAAGEMDERVACDLTNAIPYSGEIKSHYVWRGELESVRFHLAHKPPSTTRLAGLRGEAVSRSCRYLADEYDLAEELKPHVAVWGHVHWAAIGYNRGIYGYTVPSWKGIDSYALDRLAITVPGFVGGRILFIPGLDGELWSMKLFRRKLPTSPIWTPDSQVNSQSPRNNLLRRLSNAVRGDGSQKTPSP